MPQQPTTSTRTCPMCGDREDPIRYGDGFECNGCPFRCSNADYPKAQAAMELAKAVRPIVEYYDWLVSDDDGITPDDVIVGSTANPHFTGKDLEMIKRLYEVFK